MQINSQDTTSMSFGNKVRIISENGKYVAKRGKDVLGHARNANGDMRATSPFNGNSYETNAKKYYATPLKDFVKGISRKIKIAIDKKKSPKHNSNNS